MGRDDFREQIMVQWAGYYGCTVAALMEPGHVVVPRKQDDDHGFHIWQIGEQTFVEADPLYVDALNAYVQNLSDGHRFGEADARALMADNQITDVTIGDVTVGLLHYLYPDDLPPASDTPGYKIRQMTGDDKMLQELLVAACTPEEADEGWVNVTDDVAFGALCDRPGGNQLVALASAYPWRGGFLDIGVLTHPEHRRCNLGKAVVREVCAWGLEQGYVVLYRNNTVNQGSHGIAKGLGLQHYLSQVSVWLKPLASVE